MPQPKLITIEGYTPAEILAFSDEQLETIGLFGQSVILRIGSAEILGTFHLTEGRLLVELAQIDGGGEGVLRTLWLLAERVATQRGCSQIEWIVYATNCARPNPKLPRLLLRKGFVRRPLPQSGEAYYFLQQLDLAGNGPT